MASGDGSYEWSTGNLDSIIYVNPQRDTFYYVLSKPAGYCPSDTVYTKIYVNPMPKAGFKARPEWGFKPMKVQFFDESRAAIQYRWYFGNGDTDTIASPAYIYNTHGHYMVRQLVTNQYNCTDSASFEIVVFDSFYMYIPNTFTPNNNKKNDLLLLDYDPENMLQGNIQIFNRWGEMVYEADLKNYIPWDGNFHGKPVPSDAYVLVWYVTDLSRGEHHNAMILHVFR
jgi:gliding motility-associated-like protein